MGREPPDILVKADPAVMLETCISITNIDVTDIGRHIGKILFEDIYFCSRHLNKLYNSIVYNKKTSITGKN